MATQVSDGAAQAVALQQPQLPWLCAGYAGVGVLTSEGRKIDHQDDSEWAVHSVVAGFQEGHSRARALLKNKTKLCGCLYVANLKQEMKYITSQRSIYYDN